MTCDEQCRAGDMKIDIDTRLIPTIRRLEKRVKELDALIIRLVMDKYTCKCCGVYDDITGEV